MSTFLQQLLEQRILGQTKEARQCCCGEITLPESVAIAVRPPQSKEFFFLWHLWEVQMRYVEKKSGEHDYSMGLNDFIPTEEVKKIFADAENE